MTHSKNAHDKQWGQKTKRKQKVKNMSDVEAFLNELEQINDDRKSERAAARGPRTVYDVIKPEMGKVYQGYTLVSFNETQSPLGSESICLRLVAPGNDGEPEAGRRVKFYVNGYEKQDFERFVRQNNLVTKNDEDDGNTYHLPVKLDFLRKMNESQKNAGRTFKSFHGIIRDADSAALREALPEVPEDQTTTEPWTAPENQE
jgi:hypothetical protein